MPALNLQTLISGLSGAAQGFNTGQQRISDVAREQEESEFERALRLAMLAQSQERIGISRQGLKQGGEQFGIGQENALRSFGQADERIGLAREKFEFLKNKPPTTKGGLTDFQKIGLVDRVAFQQQDTLFNKLQAALEAKGVSFKGADRDTKTNLVLKAALEREAQKFADPEADRPGVGSFEQPVDPSLLQLFLQGQSRFDDTARANISQNLGQFFPSLRGGGLPPGRQNAQPFDTVSVEEALEELRRRAGAR